MESYYEWSKFYESVVPYYLQSVQIGAHADRSYCSSHAWTLAFNIIFTPCRVEHNLSSHTFTLCRGEHMLTGHIAYHMHGHLLHRWLHHSTSQQH